MSADSSPQHRAFLSALVPFLASDSPLAECFQRDLYINPMVNGNDMNEMFQRLVSCVGAFTSRTLLRVLYPFMDAGLRLSFDDEDLDPATLTSPSSPVFLPVPAPTPEEVAAFWEDEDISLDPFLFDDDIGG